MSKDHEKNKEKSLPIPGGICMGQSGLSVWRICSSPETGGRGSSF